jgi:hypothetical protein
MQNPFHTDKLALARRRDSVELLRECRAESTWGVLGSGRASRALDLQTTWTRGRRR